MDGVRASWVQAADSAGNCILSSFGDSYESSTALAGQDVLPGSSVTCFVINRSVVAVGSGGYYSDPGVDE